MTLHQKKLDRATSTRTSTFSTTCILPMLGKPWSWYGDTFKNAYIGDSNKPEYDNHILLLFEYSINERFLNLEQTMRESRHYITDYDPNPETVIFVFSVPEDFQDDYTLFRQGKYSRLSPKLKSMILGDITFGVNYDILTRSAVRRKKMEEMLETTIDPSAELLDPPNPDVEVYT